MYTKLNNKGTYAIGRKSYNFYNFNFNKNGKASSFSYAFLKKLDNSLRALPQIYLMV